MLYLRNILEEHLEITACVKDNVIPGYISCKENLTLENISTAIRSLYPHYPVESYLNTLKYGNTSKVLSEKDKIWKAYHCKTLLS